MGDHTAFFYGTLMAPPILHRVIHGTPHPTALQLSLLTTQPGLLPAHRRHRVQHCDYPAIVPAADACVRGTLVRGLTDADLWRLDRFEGDEYARVRVRVRVLAGGGRREEVLAEAYVWVAGEGGLEAGEWDFETFRREKMGRWVGEGEYADVDEAVEAGGGDPTGGRGVSGRITGKLEGGEEEEEVLKSAV